MSTRDIQQALKDKGFDPGPIDGIWGRQTIGAVKKFQESAHLTVDGIVGPHTTEALFGKKVAPDDIGPLVWYNEALHLAGTKEVSGGGSNKTILDWAKKLDIAYSGDDIPWCGLFVAHCVGATLPDERLPPNPLGARSWEKFGKPCDTPTFGCVLVFWRVSKASGLGHVGFYYGEDDDTYYVLGGNQSDMVRVSRVDKDRLVAARQPATVAKLPLKKVTRTSTELVSTNEA